MAASQTPCDSCLPSSADSELTSLCQSVLEDFNLCLFYLPSVPSAGAANDDEEECESGYSFLPDLLIFRMVVVCLMSVHSLKRAGKRRVLSPVPAGLRAAPPQHGWAGGYSPGQRGGAQPPSPASPPLTPRPPPLQAPSSTARPLRSRWRSFLTSSTTSTSVCRRSWKKARTRCQLSRTTAQVSPGRPFASPSTVPLARLQKRAWPRPNGEGGVRLQSCCRATRAAL